MRLLRSILIFFVSFLVYHIGFGCSVFPVDENNVLQAPIWYPLVGFAICAAAAVFAWRAGNGATPAQRKNHTPTHISKSENTLPAKGTEKEYAQDLIDEAKHLAVDINNASTVFDFTYSYREFLKVVEKLIYLNEKKNIYMVPSPRSELAKAESNIGATINDFIFRAVEKIWSSGAEWADQVDLLLDEIEHNNFFSGLLTQENKRHILELRENAAAARDGEVPRQVRRSASSEKVWQTTTTVNQEKYPQRNCSASIERVSQPVFTVDFERIIKEEFAWRKEQMGLTSIEAEIERVDSMDGHTFEQWCAHLLRASGFTDVEVTRGSGDQGVDVLATLDGVRYAVQCKCYSSDLGNKPVQEVYAGRAIYNCQIGSVMTNRHFTVGAKELAKATNVFLWDRDWIISLLEELDDDAFPL